MFIFPQNKTLNDIYHSTSYESLKTIIKVEKEVYEHLKSICIDLEEEVDTYDYEGTFPISIVGFSGVKAFHRHTYTLYDSDGSMIAGEKDNDVALTVKFVRGKFVLTKAVYIYV